MQLDTVSLAIAVAVVLVAITAAISSGLLTPVALQKDKAVTLTLTARTQLTPNVFKFRFALPSARHVLGLPVGQHMTLSATTVTNGKSVSRSYTPVTGNDDVGFVEFVIKVYFKNEHPKFPAGGAMSQHLHSMKVGETIRAFGPKGALRYHGLGRFHVRHPRSGKFERSEETKNVSRVGMIAGGTGLTPMLQMVTEALKDKTDPTEWSLLFANQTPDDIMLREELDAVAASDKRFSVWYTVDTATEGWVYDTGFINADMIKDHLPGPAAGTLILVCGPPPMVTYACLPALDQLGFNDENVVCEGMPKSTKALFADYYESKTKKG